MKLFIPPLGTKLKLLDSWSFSLYCENRNRSLWDLFYKPMDSIPHHQRKRIDPKKVMLSRADEFTVDRIYIRKNLNSYDSVTFRGTILHEGVYRKVRFWVKLTDANNMEVEVVE